MFKISFLLGTLVSAIFFLVLSTGNIKEKAPAVVKNKTENSDSIKGKVDTLFLSSGQTNTFNFR